MDELYPARARRVFILGPEATLDVGEAARRVVAEAAELVLVSLGHPASPAQTAVVTDALHLADELRLWVDAVLVTSPEQVSETVKDGDQVTILASGRERRTIERVLGGRVVLDHAHVAPRRAAPAHVRRAATRPAPAAVPVTEPAPTAVAAYASPGGAALGTDLSEDATTMDELEASPGVPSSESVEALAGRQVVEPTTGTVWTKEDAVARKRGTLRVYLGAAPGVGKTYAMLGEGQRRRTRGTDVIVGVVHTYDRPKTIGMLEGLEVIPRRRISYRGTAFEEMDVDAVIARRPEVALIDELAHTNIPGSRRAKRWEDVLDILAEGISVISTLNVQHLASVNDVVSRVTGVRQQETVPDWLLDLADDIELVDMSPNALQRRMVHGNIYRDPRKAELALRRFFTTDNLTALRELALMRVANRVDESLLARWSKEGTPETRERILVCLSRPAISDDLIRRGGRIAQRTRGDLIAAHVVTGGGPSDRKWLAGTERLVRDLGGEFVVLEADDPVEAVLSFAYQQHVTQIVVGESTRSRWREMIRGSFVNELIRRASNIDVHVIARLER